MTLFFVLGTDLALCLQAKRRSTEESVRTKGDKRCDSKEIENRCLLNVISCAARLTIFTYSHKPYL